MNLEKIERILKYALILTILMTVFSTGMNVTVLLQQGAQTSFPWWSPIQQALLIIGPIVIIEFLAYRRVKKKNAEAAAERERIEKEKARLERKAKADERRAKQQRKKK